MKMWTSTTNSRKTLIWANKKFKLTSKKQDSFKNTKTNPNIITKMNRVRYIYDKNAIARAKTAAAGFQGSLLSLNETFQSSSNISNSKLVEIQRQKAMMRK